MPRLRREFPDATEMLLMHHRQNPARSGMVVVWDHLPGDELL